ncbi:hypothetical protein [Ferrovibrio sp.]|uniref:hypothetical protein n=1 Tax=Ferrovibrio sp. TaxID=1917215 RepID=UPI0026020DC3|nr:hypothetical protein [Ferrovibrio sp.]
MAADYLKQIEMEKLRLQREHDRSHPGKMPSNSDIYRFAQLTREESLERVYRVIR